MADWTDEEDGYLGYYCPNCGHRGRGDSDILEPGGGIKPGEQRVKCKACNKDIVGPVVDRWIIPNKPSSESRCFIATAVLDGDHVEDLAVLRQFRDSVLLRASLGRKAVRIYETVSPPVASLVASSPIRRVVVRTVVVRPAVWLARRLRPEPGER